MDKSTNITPIPARSKSVENAGQDENDPFMEFIEALARRRARLDARASAPPILDDEPPAKERNR